ncbi:MAG: hypothetical protein ACREXX_21890 [Gammaproteobacteria bacterium]
MAMISPALSYRLPTVFQDPERFAPPPCRVRYQRRPIPLSGGL